MIRNSVLFLFLSIVLTACGTPEAPKEKKQLPEPESQGAKLLKHYCTNCHGAPMPGVHKQNEWRNVVYRMNVRRLKRALGTIPEDEVEILVAYMEKHSK